MAPVDSSKSVHAIDLDSSFLWSVFTANLGYILLATFQKFYAKTYPARRHHSDAFSMAVIVVHILSGSTVVFGGCACWLAMHYVRINHSTNPIPTWAAQTLAIAAIGHSATNLLLLRKIPGARVFNVPLYVFSTVYNTCRAWWLWKAAAQDQSSTELEILLLWCAVSTYVWVRYFLFLFGAVSASRFPDDREMYRVVYTLSLPYAAVLGIVAPATMLGGVVDDRWTFALVSAVAVLGPPMIGLHRVCVRVGSWPWVRRWGICRWVVQFLLDSMNPVEYHGEPFEGKENNSLEDCGQKKCE